MCLIFIPKIGQLIRPKTVDSPVGGYTPKNNLMRKDGYNENRIFKRVWFEPGGY